MHRVNGITYSSPRTDISTMGRVTYIPPKIRQDILPLYSGLSGIMLAQSIISSIEKWRRVRCLGEEEGRLNCALCTIDDHSHQSDRSKWCLNCPIYRKIWQEEGIRAKGCANTPYEDWDGDWDSPELYIRERQEAARKELTFLEELFMELYFVDFVGGVI